jgi:hypothetical protein
MASSIEPREPVNLVNPENLATPLHLARENPLETVRCTDEKRSLFVDPRRDA